MSRTAFAITMISLLVLMWLMIAMYIAQPALPEPVKIFMIDEPDAGPGLFQADLEVGDQAPPQMFAAPCPIGPQNYPVVDPERTV